MALSLIPLGRKPCSWLPKADVEGVVARPSETCAGHAGSLGQGGSLLGTCGLEIELALCSGLCCLKAGHVGWFAALLPWGLSRGTCGWQTCWQLGRGAYPQLAVGGL